MVSGTAIWEVGDQTVEAVKGTTILIPPGVPHKVRSEEGCKILCIFGPGQQEGQFEEISNLTPEQQQDDGLKNSILSKYNIVRLEWDLDAGKYNYMYGVMGTASLVI